MTLTSDFLASTDPLYVRMSLSLLGSYDRGLYEHSVRVADYAVTALATIRADTETLKETRMCALLHDLGKITIPRSLLYKPYALSEMEFYLMQQHSGAGARVLQAVDELKDYSLPVLHHHERWDGTGYPSGLKGEHIPFISRLIAVADAFEAMTFGRPYRAKMTVREAAKELVRSAESHFDPYMVRIFLKSLGKNQPL